jgi:hypothetical protein
MYIYRNAFSYVLITFIALTLSSCSSESTPEEEKATENSANETSQQIPTKTIKEFLVKEAKWQEKKKNKSWLGLKGRALDGVEITIVPLRDPNLVLGKVVAENNKWDIKIEEKDLTFTPCTVRVIKSSDEYIDQNVRGVPEDCDVDYGG